eukprot:264956_1
MANPNLTDAQMCQMAIEHLSKRITIQFPEYPEFGSKFAAICIEEGYDELWLLIEDVTDGFDESSILETLADKTEIKEHHKEPLCSYIHSILSTFPTSLGLATISIKTTAEERSTMRDMLLKHAPLFIPDDFKDDCRLKLFAIGRRHRFPLVTYLLDLYARYRLLEHQKLNDELVNIPQQTQRKREQFIHGKMYNVMSEVNRSFLKKCHVMKVLTQQARKDKQSETLLVWFDALFARFFRRAFPPPLRLPP